MPYDKYTPDEVTARGEAIYEQKLRADIEHQHQGKFLVIDIDSGAYEIDENDVIATKRLLAVHPKAVIYGKRIGARAAYRLGHHYTGSFS